MPSPRAIIYKAFKKYMPLKFIEKAVNNEFIKLWLTPVVLDLLLCIPSVSGIKA